MNEENDLKADENCKKRPLESRNDDMDCSPKKPGSQEAEKLCSSPEEDERKAKKLKTQSFKNAVQLLNEITQVRPVTYQFTGFIETNTKKPMFMCELSFSTDNGNTTVTLTASGSSKRLAKAFASIKAIHYLTEKIKLFHSPLLNCYYRESINVELKSLNMTLEDIIDDITKVPSPPNQPSSIQVSPLKTVTSPKDKSPPPLNQTEPGTNPLFLLKNDNKTSEMLKTQNPINILNYLFSNEVKFDDIIEKATKNIADELNGQKVGVEAVKTFRSQLTIRKDAQSSRFTRNSTRTEPVDSMFVRETDEEFQFIGVGTSKKKAKLKAALIAMNYLFSIKLAAENDLNNGLYFNII